MANVVKKYTISSELEQKMVNEAMAKARELRVTENVAILDEDCAMESTIETHARSTCNTYQVKMKR